MVINWYGESCFKITSGALTLAADPFMGIAGLQAPRFRTDVALKTLTTLTDLGDVRAGSETRAIIGPGEYEVKGIEIKGNRIKGESNKETIKTIFTVAMEGIRLGFLGYISKPADAEELESFNNIDILFIPGGGVPYLGQEEAAKIIKQVEPKIVVPTLFKIPNLKRKASDVKEFIRALGIPAKDVGNGEKLTLKKKDLPKKLEVAILSV